MGNSRTPGTEGLGLRPASLNDGTSALTLMPRPGPTGATLSALGGARLPSGDVLAMLAQATDGRAVEKVAVALLGGQCFSVGVIVGAGADIITSAVDLLKLAKMFVLADLHDLNSGKFSTLDLSSPVTSGTRLILAKLAGAVFEEHLRAAAAERDALLNEMAEALKDPQALFGKLADSVVEDLKKDWRDYNTHMNAWTLQDRFHAGRIVGKLLVVLIGLVTGVVGAVRGASALAAKLPRLVKLARGWWRNRLGGGGGAPTPPKLPAPAPKKSVPPPKPREPDPPKKDTPVAKPWRPPPPKTGDKYADKAMKMTKFGEQWDKDHPVKIYNAEELEKYRVVPRPGDGKLVYAADGQLVNADLETHIYVMDKSGNLYVTRHKIFEVHHSSLAGGKDPVAAGMVQIDDGKLVTINENTGHYGRNQPSGRSTLVKEEMTAQGANTAATEAVPYDKDKPW